MATVNIGTIQANVRLNLSNADRELARLGRTATSVSDYFKKTGKSTEQMGKNIQKSTKSIKQQRKMIAKQTKEFQKQLPAGKKIQESQTIMADGTVRASRRIVDANKSTIMSMLSLRSFMQKIVHYITFSIGVQMVMRIQQAFQSMLDTLYEFRKEVANTATVAGYVGEDFEDASESIADFSKNMAKDTVYSAQQVAAALYTVASAGYDVVEMARNFEDQLEESGEATSEFQSILDYAAATQTNLEDATKSILVVLKQFNMELSDINEVTDTFTALITNSFLTQEKLAEGMKYAGVTAGVVGASFQQTASSLALLVDRGLAGGQAGQRLNMVFTKLLKPSDEAREMLEQMGLTLNDVNPQYHSLVQILYKLKAAGFDAADAANMFRARTAASAIALVENIDSIEQYMNKIRDSGGLTEEIASRQQKAYAGMVATTTTMFSDLAAVFGESIQRSLTGMMRALQGIEPILTALGKNFQSMVDSIKLVVITLISYKLALMKLNIMSKIFITTEAQAVNGVIGFGMAAKTTSLNIHGLTTAIKGTIAAHSALIIKTAVIFTVINSLSNIVTGAADSLDYLALVAVAAGVAMAKFASSVTIAIASIKISLGTVGAIIAVLGAILSAVGLLTGGYDEEKEKLKSLRNEQEDYLEGLEKIGYNTEEYTEAHIRYLKSLNREQELLDEINRQRKEGATNTEEYADNLAELSTVNSEQADNIDKIIQLTSFHLSTIQNMNDEIGNATSLYKKFADTQQEQIDNNELVADLQKRQSEAFTKLTWAMGVYGEGSTEVVKAQNEYNRISKDLNRTQEDGRSLQERLTETQTKFIKSYDDLSDAEQVAVSRAKELYNTRLLLYNQLDEMERLQSEITTWRALEGNYTKNLDESIKRLTERKWKLYEIEMKRYKLQQDRGKNVEDLFEALAEEGMLTDDIIESYKTMKKTEGEKIKAQVSFSKVLSNFTADQQDMITNWVEEYVDSGGDIEAANAEVGYSLDSIIGMSDSYISSIISYGNALYAYESSVETASNLTKEFTEDLIDNELASSNIADAYDNMVSSENEIITLTDKYNEKLKELSSQGMQDVIDQAARMWVGLGGFPEMDLGEWTMKDTLKFDWEEGETIKEFFDELSGPEEFEDALLEINQRTGYFADKTADSKAVLQGYIQFMKSQGIDAIDAWSSEMASAAIAYKRLESAGYSHQQILQMAGYDFKTLGSMGRSALLDIETDAEGAAEKIDTLRGHIEDLTNDLIALSQEDFYINVYLNLEEEIEEEPPTKQEKFWAREWELRQEGLSSTEAYEQAVEELGYEGRPISLGISASVDGQSILESLWSTLTNIFGSSRGDKVSDSTTKDIDVTDQFNESERNAETLIEDINRIPRDIYTHHHLIRHFENTGDTESGPLTNTIQSSEQVSQGVKDTVTDWFEDIKDKLPFDFRNLQRGALIRGPQMAMIGEAGDEAVIPLEGRNRKKGKELLEYILPRYFPDIKLMQGGALVGGGTIESPAVASTMVDTDTSLLEDFYTMVKDNFSRLLGEYTTTEEDLEIDDEEFKTGVKEGTLSFKAILLNTGQYIRALFNESVSNITSSIGGLPELITSLRSVFDNLISSLNNICNQLNIIINEIATALSASASNIQDTSIELYNNIEDASSGFGTVVTSAAMKVYRALSKPIKVSVNVNRNAEGGIYNKPSLGMFGEAGAEAIVPLENNRGAGRQILESIIPKYYPELMNQTGGVFGSSRTINYGVGDSFSESYSIMGPVNVVSQDPVDFTNKLKEQYKRSPGKR